ncbi:MULTISPECIES: hypothetical protein [Segatella]|nr:MULTISPECIES: hypothetical protein [Segatella]MDR4932067.1 hypothetical protein [Segatella bryantii]
MNKTCTIHRRCTSLVVHYQVSEQLQLISTPQDVGELCFVYFN